MKASYFLTIKKWLSRKKMDEYKKRENINELIEIDHKSRRKAKYIVFIIVGLMVFNSIFLTIIVWHNGGAPKGNESGFNALIDVMSGVFFAYWIVFNILGLILGSIVSLFPYKGLSYGQRYFIFSQYVILIFHILVTIVISRIILEQFEN